MDYKINVTPGGIREFPMHTHASYEVMLYLEGDGYMRTEKGDYRFTPGTIIIVAPGVRHGSVSKNGFKNIEMQIAES